MKKNEQGKVSVKTILNPLMLGAKHYTREELVEKLRAQRPDLASPGSTVSKRFMLLQAEGKNPVILNAEPRARKGAASIGELGREKSLERWFNRRVARLEKWAAEATEEVSSGFKRLKEYQAAEAARPRLRRVWP